MGGMQGTWGERQMTGGGNKEGRKRKEGKTWKTNGKGEIEEM